MRSRSRKTVVPRGKPSRAVRCAASTPSRMPRAPLTKSALHVASAAGGGALRSTVLVTVRVTLWRLRPLPTYDVTLLRHLHALHVRRARLASPRLLADVQHREAVAHLRERLALARPALILMAGARQVVARPRVRRVAGAPRAHRLVARIGARVEAHVRRRSRPRWRAAPPARVIAAAGDRDLARTRRRRTRASRRRPGTTTPRRLAARQQRGLRAITHATHAPVNPDQIHHSRPDGSKSRSRRERDHAWRRRVDRLG